MFRTNQIYNIYIYLKRNFQLFIILILIIVILKTYNNSKIDNKSNGDKYKKSYYTKFYIFYFNLTYINYSFSFKYKIAKVEYNIGFYNENNDLINPSDLTLYNKLHIVCNFIENNKNNTIYSLPNIDNNQYFKCIHFFNLYNKEIFGIN